MPPSAAAGTTVSIPLTTLPVGSHDFGPASISDADSLIIITIDRTVSGGLNALTSADSITMTPFQSNDGGITFHQLAQAVTTGGVTAKGDSSSVIGVGLWPGISRQVKANVTVAGASIAVQGSVATQ